MKAGVTRHAQLRQGIVGRCAVITLLGMWEGRGEEKKEEKRRGGGKKKERRKRERVNNRHTVPPTAKVSAFSRNGGTGADPAVNNASSAHKRTATNPMLVAVARVISFG